MFMKGDAGNYGDAMSKNMEIVSKMGTVFQDMAKTSTDSLMMLNGQVMSMMEESLQKKKDFDTQMFKLAREMNTRMRDNNNKTMDMIKAMFTSKV